MKDRIKEIRKKLRLTQQAFAEALGIKQNTVATYEIGRIIPSDAVITLICREFNVNEEWLRTGDGEPFKALGREEQISNYFHDLEGLNEELKKRLVSALAAIGEEDWKIIKELVEKIVRDNEGKEQTADGNARLHADLDRQCAEKQNPKEGSVASTAI